MAKNHMILGAASGFVAAHFTNQSGVTLLVASGIGLISALLPDIDHPRSKAGRAFWPFSWLLAKILGHRGITHSLIVVFGLLAFLRFAWDKVTPQEGAYLVAFVLGYLSHLVGDFLTPRGIPLFWPYKKNYRVRFFKTGSAMESIFVFALLSSAIAYWSYQI